MLASDSLYLIALWFAFALPHILLSLGPIRGWLVARIGEAKFIAVYCAVAVLTFAVLINYYATHNANLEITTQVSNIGLAIAFGAIFIMFGMSLVLDCVLHYTRSPSAPNSTIDDRPRGMQQITRHPFLTGIAIIFGVHMLFASSVFNAIFYAGFVALAVVGTIHLDKKLTMKKGAQYARYIEKTSVIPFLANMSGRHPLDVRDIPKIPIVFGIVATAIIYLLHESLMNNGGFWFAGAVILIGVVETTIAWRS